MGRLIQNDGCFDWTNSGSATVNSGDPVVVGTLVGVAIRAIPVGETGALATCGIYELEKTNSAITLGAAVYLTSTLKATASSSSATLCGHAVAAAAADDATVKVILNV